MVISFETKPRVNTEAWMKTVTSKNDYIGKLFLVRAIAFEYGSDVWLNLRAHCLKYRQN